jgi:hypothetical protein
MAVIKRALAGVGHAQQAHVGQHPQFQLQLLLLAGPAGCLLARRAVGAALEVQVAEATVAALGQQHRPSGSSSSASTSSVSASVDDGAHRHAQHDVVGRRAVLVGAAAGFAVARLVAAGVAVVDQRVQVAVGHREDAAAAAAVTAVGAAERDELLASKAHAARTAVAGGDVDGGFVDEFHGGPSQQTQKPRRAGASSGRQRAAGPQA